MSSYLSFGSAAKAAPSSSTTAARTTSVFSSLFALLHADRDPAQLIDDLLKPMEDHTNDARAEEELARLPVWGTCCLS